MHVPVPGQGVGWGGEGWGDGGRGTRECPRRKGEEGQAPIAMAPALRRVSPIKPIGVNSQCGGGGPELAWDLDIGQPESLGAWGATAGGQACVQAMGVQEHE